MSIDLDLAGLIRKKHQLRKENELLFRENADLRAQLKRLEETDGSQVSFLSSSGRGRG